MTTTSQLPDSARPEHHATGGPFATTANFRSGPPLAAAALAIDARDLTRSFGSVRAVDGVSLQVAPGEIVAFLGPNGAGKTTTIDMVLGLGKPDSGLARMLHLSEGTVRNHLSSAIGKTGGRNRADAARIAEQNGWL